MKRLLLLNSFAGAANTIVNIGLMAVTVPVFIDRLGMVAYGIFALISLVSIINVIGSFGFSTSLIKYLAEQGRTRESNADIQVTLIFLTVLSILLTIAAIHLERFIITGVIGLNAAQYTDEVSQCYRYFVIANIFNLMMQTSFAVFDSLQKVYISSMIQFGFNVLSRGAMLMVLLSAPSLSEMGLVYLMASIGAAVVSVSAIFIVWGNFLTMIPLTTVSSVLRKHSSYSASVYVTTMFGLVYEVATKIVVNRFIGITEVGIFDIAVRVKNLFWSVGERLLYPVLPHIAQLDEQNAKRFVHEIEEKMTYVVLPGVVTFAYCAPTVLDLWIGPQSSHSLMVATIAFVAVNMLALTVVPTYQFLMMKGQQLKNAAMQLTNVLVTFGLFFMLHHAFGFYAIIISYASAILCSFALANFFKVRSGITTFDQLLRQYRILMLLVFLAAMDGIVVWALEAAWLSTVVIIALNALGSLTAFRFQRYFSQQDIERYFGHFPVLHRMMRTLLVQP